MVDTLHVEDWHWEITRKCNLSCTHCIIGYKKISQVSTDDALDMVAKMASLGGRRLYITGGEPFLRSDLRPIVSRAKALGFSVNIITNGILQDLIISFVTNGLVDHLGVSVDGNEEIHDLVRGYGAYSKAISTLQEIVRVGLPVTVYLTVNSLNLNYLGRILAELIEMGVSSFHLNEINQGGRAKINRHLLISELNEENKLSIIASQLEQLIELGDLFIDRSCAVSPEIAYIDFNGDVYACAEIAITDPESKVASLLDDNFQKQFWQYYPTIKIPGRCRYSVIGLPGVSVCLNCSDSCPLTVKGGLA